MRRLRFWGMPFALATSLAQPSGEGRDTGVRWSGPVDAEEGGNAFVQMSNRKDTE